MIARDQLHRELARVVERGLLAGATPTEVAAELLELLDQPVTGPAHPPLELVVDRLSLFTRDTPDGMRVRCDGRTLEARPYWRGGL